ncbi:MAG: hypothetical protein J0H83_13115 [Candidatus Melainabacteria bacterium]|nr:hypothetical protein [Candidatus Melainabacteria bacterium]
MSDHKLGDAVFNDDRARAGEGQRVLQAAEAIWGRPEVPSKHEALHRPETQGNRQERLAEASHRIKELNNSLHGAGQPLHGSNLELIGFDKKGRLLLLEREKDGGIQGKVLVDSLTGKIVAKTKPGELDKWQKGQDYERDAQGGTVDLSKNQAKPDVYRSVRHESHDGARIGFDAHNHVITLETGMGDRFVYGRDAAGRPDAITILRQGGKPEMFRRGADIDGIHNPLWYAVAADGKLQVDRPGYRFEVRDDGALVQHKNAKDHRIYGVDGSIVDEAAGKQKVVRAGVKR